jgi:hypothetical protein
MEIEQWYKLLWKLFNENGIWEKIISNKYFQKLNLCQVSARHGDLHFWQGSMEIKRLLWKCVIV